jgi:hypothetical protein
MTDTDTTTTTTGDVWHGRRSPAQGLGCTCNRCIGCLCSPACVYALLFRGTYRPTDTCRQCELCAPHAERFTLRHRRKATP